MPRRGRRVNVDTGVYRDDGGIDVVVKVGGKSHSRRLDANATRVEWLKAHADLLEEFGG